jgi:hypothetical protein
MHRRIDRVVRTLLIVGLPLRVLACAAAQTADPAPVPQPVTGGWIRQALDHPMKGTISTPSRRVRTRA